MTSKKRVTTMANTEITILQTRSFKSPELNSAVKSFDKFFTGIEKNWRDACILMHRLADGKKYELDGFKSVAEFAETIGIEKSTAHKMADAGMVYDSKVPAIAQFAADAGYTKAAKVASIVKDGKSDELAKAIEDGEIHADDTVDTISSWKATKAAQAKGTKVVPTFKITGHAFSIDSKDPTKATVEAFEHIVGIERPEDWAREFDSTAIVTKTKDATNEALYLAITADGCMFEYSAIKVKKEPAKAKAKKSLDDMTPEEFKAWAEARGMKITFTNTTEE